MIADQTMQALTNIGVTYDILTNLSLVPSQPFTFTNAQVLDTEAEGMVDGRLTVVDTSTGVVTVTTDTFKMTGTASWTTTGLVSPDGLARGIGRVFMFDAVYDNTVGTNILCGIMPSATIGTGSDGHFYVDPSGLYVIGALIGTLTNGVMYQLATALDASGARYFAKGGTEYPAWTLISTQTALDAATLYPEIVKNAASASGTTVERLACPTELYPELITGSDYSVLDTI